MKKSNSGVIKLLNGLLALVFQEDKVGISFNEGGSWGIVVVIYYLKGGNPKVSYYFALGYRASWVRFWGVCNAEVWL